MCIKLTDMLPAYRYSPIKVLHFNINKKETESCLHDPNKLTLLHRELIPKYLIYDILDNATEYRVDIRYTFRLAAKEGKISFVSYISEQSFYMKYVDDKHPMNQIKVMYENSTSGSAREFEKLTEIKNLPKELKFPSFHFPDSAKQELFALLKAKAR